MWFRIWNEKRKYKSQSDHLRDFSYLVRLMWLPQSKTNSYFKTKNTFAIILTSVINVSNNLLCTCDLFKVLHSAQRQIQG